MRARPIAAVVLALGIPTLAFAPLVVAAGKADKTSKPAAAPADTTKHDPNNVTGISPFMETVVAGNVKEQAKDFPGALELYRKATQMSPKNPFGHYLLGEALFASGDMANAEQSWLTADQVAENGPPSVRAKVIFVLADLKERQKKYDEAKALWARYTDLTAKFPDAGAFPASAASRTQMIDDMLKQDKAYEIVRQRIKDDKDGAAPK